MIMREVSIRHGMQSAKDVLRPFGRVMLKLITTGNQLSPDMLQPDHFPDWGPNIQKVEGDLRVLLRRFRCVSYRPGPLKRPGKYLSRLP
jgi:heterodisulfide reductase subunit C